MRGTLTAMLGLGGLSIAAVIGCGGKTSLIQALAEENTERAVLISPTTRIYPMEGGVGVYRAATGKLEALPQRVLKSILPHYSLVLLEADGSRGLPCKGWREDEPVVPEYCTHTIGVVTLGGVGCEANEAVCLRLPLFQRLTGVQAGQVITLSALTRMVCASEGMFRRSAGKCMLMVNQVESAEAEALAKQWLIGIRAEYPGRFEGLFYGSVHQGQWQSV